MLNFIFNSSLRVEKYLEEEIFEKIIWNYENIFLIKISFNFNYFKFSL
jgi:hypothetical protein